MELPKLNVAGVVLAAGESRRMGQPKALLEINGSTFLQTILNNLEESFFSPLIVMTGNNDKLLKEHLKKMPQVVCLNNPNVKNGQISSLQIAIENIPANCLGLLQCLVDHPLVKLSTYKSIIKQVSKKPDHIIIPVFNGKKGHPVYFGRNFFRNLLEAPLTEGARHVVSRHAKEIICLDVDDEGILIDIDTPAEYHSHI